MDDKFEKFYQDTLSPLVAELEAERLAVRKSGFIAAIPIVSAFVLALVLQNLVPFPILFIAGVIGSVILYIIHNKKKNRYIERFKNEVIRKIICFVDPGFEYQPGHCVSQKDYKSSGLFLKQFQRYKGDDFISGKHGDTMFCCSELHTEYKVQSGKQTRWVTIFKGLFFMADFNKNFTGRTYVWSEGNPQLNFFSKLFSSFDDGLEKIKLESPDFEKRFIVYGSDQVESRYLLSPTMMERMVKLDDEFNGGVVFSFIRSHINVAITVTKPLFEPTIFNAANINTMRNYYKTMTGVLALIDDLNLNLRIWNK